MSTNRPSKAYILCQLYPASAITLTMYSHQELYNYYQTLLSTPRYTDRPSKAAKATAKGFKVATEHRVLGTADYRAVGELGS